MYKLYFLLFLLALAQATDLDSYDGEDGEERTIFTSGGTYYIALNTTYLLLWSLLLGGLLLGALFLAGGSGASADSGYGTQYGGYGQKKSGFEEGFNRNKRDMYEYGLKDQLNLLAEAFHKYEIAEDTGCQLYISCESSSASHYKNRPLAKTVNAAMRAISQPQNADLYEDDKYLLDILNAYDLGLKGQSCEHFRKLCKNDKIYG